MIPVQFPEANAALARDQGEYEPLPVYIFNDAQGRMAMCFRLSPKELEEIARTRTLWIQQLTFGRRFQPVPAYWAFYQPSRGPPRRILVYDPQVQSQISIYRQKAIEGTLTLDDMKTAIKMLREGRETAQSAAKASKSKSKAPVNVDNLLGELGI